MKIYELEHNSPEWFAARCGLATSSNFHKIVTPATCQLSKQADDYMYQLIGERITGEWEESPWTMDMERGHKLEPIAAETYEFMTNTKTRKNLFITDDRGMVGCSPDRLVGDDGCLEIKSPKAKTHVKYMVEGIKALGNDYKPQYMGHLLLTKRKFVDVFSYHPEMQPVLIRVERDEDYIAKLEEAIDGFIIKMGAAIDKLRENNFIEPPELDFMTGRALAV